MREAAEPWCEASQHHVCMANLQHHCLWVPELLSLRRMKAVVGAPIPGCQDKSQGCMLSPRALNGCGQGREVAVAYCDSGRARTWHRHKDRQSYTRDREALEKTQGGVLESPWLVEV